LRLISLALRSYWDWPSLAATASTQGGNRWHNLRPYPALKLFRDAMYAALKDKLPPDVWDYPTP